MYSIVQYSNVFAVTSGIPFPVLLGALQVLSFSSALGTGLWLMQILPPTSWESRCPKRKR